MPERNCAIYRITALIVLLVLLVLANVIGNASPYLYLVTLLGALPFLLRDQLARADMNRWESYGYLVAFLCIGLAYVFAAGGWSNFDNLGNFLPYLFFGPAVGLFGRSAGRGNIQRLGSLALVGAFLSAMVATYEIFFLGADRVVGFVNTTNPFAMTSVMLGFLSLAAFWSVKSSWRYIYFIGPVLGTYAAVLAGTRAAILIALVLGMLFVVSLAKTLSKMNAIILALAATSVIGLSVSALIYLGAGVRAFSAIQSVQHFLTTGSAIDRSVAIRLELYRGGIMAFLEAPLFGHGSRHHVQAAIPYMEPEIGDEIALWSHLHNDYINFAALAGVFGLISYFLYLLIPVFGCWKSVRDTQYDGRLYAAFVVTLSYAIYGLFGSAFAAELLLGFGVICTAALLGYCRDEATKRQDHSKYFRPRPRSHGELVR